MSDKKFKFISPGVFVDEIDNSQLPAEAAPIGPLLIGRTRKGPGMKPVTVSSFSEFVSVFGEPIAGGQGEDVWRDGNLTAPTYAAYAAQAWLKNNPTITMVRLLGEQHPDVADGAAGAAGYKIGAISNNAEGAGKGGAFGLYVFPSGTWGDGASLHLSGTLAAVFYVSSGSLNLSGSHVGDANTLTPMGCRLMSSQTDGDFVMTFGNTTTNPATATTNEKFRFNFDRTSDRFIRKVFNTNPTLLNGDITATSAQKNFFLGESFEHNLPGGSDNFLHTAAGSPYVGAPKFGVLLPMQNNAGVDTEHNDRLYAAKKATTGWFIGQDLTNTNTLYKPESQQKLFRFEARDAGEQLQKEVKISITDIKAPSNDFEQYGSFTVLVRKINDTDATPVVLERYSNCNLNPASPNYIARQIGDKYSTYDSTEKRLRYYGNYLNKSDMLRVVVNEDVDRGAVDPLYLPFGFFGHTKYRDVAIAAGEDALNVFGDVTSTPNDGAGAWSMVDGGGATAFHSYVGHNGLDTRIVEPAGHHHLNIRFPEIPLVVSSSQGSGLAPKKAYFGMYTGKTTSDPKFNTAVMDCLRSLGRGSESNPAPEGTVDVTQALAAFGGTAGNTDWAQEGSKLYVVPYVFSLDDVSPVDLMPKEAKYARGERAGGTSFSAGRSAPATTADNVAAADEANATWQNVLDAGFNKFTTCFHGGFDGLDIREREPFRNSGLGASETADYALHSLVRAIDIVRDPEVVEYNLIAAPGITKTTVTQKLLDVCEDRGDAMAVIDLENVFTASTENSASLQTRSAATLDSCVNSLKDRGINSSYGACYYPWVRISDTITNQSLWAPPSVAALGAYSFTDRTKAPWFAPAGFHRGGLTEGAGGVPVLDVSRRLSSEERDQLYEANINPIAQFPAEGIVIFGQKTLQVTRSALDRVNVRRLMIFLKKEISFIASRMLFDQNTQSTWNRFIGQAEPILRSVKSRFGLEEFRLILDESTTTPDLIDRNIMYAKILLKPTRSVEFFAIDFVITNTGASFDD